MTSDELKKLRSDWQLSQTELAKKLGVRQSRISEWESGVKLIPSYIVRLLECLKKNTPKVKN